MRCGWCVFLIARLRANRSSSSSPLPPFPGWALGDLIAQKFIGKAVFDLSRFLRLSAFGALYHGPSGHYFYNWLDRKIDGKGPKVVAIKGERGRSLESTVRPSFFLTATSLAALFSLDRPGFLVPNLHVRVLHLPRSRLR